MIVLLNSLLGCSRVRVMSVIQRYVADRDMITGIDERGYVECIHSYANTS